MSNPRTLSSIALAVSLLGSAPALSSEPDARAAIRTHIMVTPDQLEWGDCSAALPPGARCAVLEGDLKAAGVLFGYRVRFPDGYRIAPHYHPADEHILVVTGTFNMGMGDRYDPSATRALTAGGFAVMPKGAPHFAWTKGETIVHVYAIGPWGLTYLNPADDPRNTSQRGR